MSEKNIINSLNKLKTKGQRENIIKKIDHNYN